MRQVLISTEGKTITVVGATGRQGGQVVQHLLAQGWRVRALTRMPESKKAQALTARGVDVRKADLEDRASLEAAFENSYGLYNMQPPAGRMEAEIRQGRNAAEAAKKMGIQHLVFGSAGPGQTKTGIEQWDAKIEIAKTMRDLAAIAAKAFANSEDFIGRDLALAAGQPGQSRYGSYLSSPPRGNERADLAARVACLSLVLSYGMCADVSSSIGKSGQTA